MDAWRAEMTLLRRGLTANTGAQSGTNMPETFWKRGRRVIRR